MNLQKNEMYEEAEHGGHQNELAIRHTRQAQDCKATRQVLDTIKL